MSKSLAFLLTGLVGFLIAILGINLVWNSGVAVHNQAERTESKIELIPLIESYVPESHALFDIALLDNGKIFSVGYNGSARNALRVSKDSGKTWSEIKFPADLVIPYSIFFVDENRGWISAVGEVYGTHDGGKNWVLSDLKHYLDFTVLHFANESTGYLAGKYNVSGNERGEIWKTEDGGETWVKVFEDDDSGAPYSIIAVSDKIAFCSFPNGVFRTFDGGKSWNHVKSFTSTVNDIYRQKNDRVWLVGGSGLIKSSVDRGHSWVKPKDMPRTANSLNLNSIMFVNDMLGFAVGDNGSIIVTKNGGDKWSKVEDRSKEDFHGVYANRDNVFILGNKMLYKVKY